MGEWLRRVESSRDERVFRDLQNGKAVIIRRIWGSMTYILNRCNTRGVLLQWHFSSVFNSRRILSAYLINKIKNLSRDCRRRVDYSIDRLKIQNMFVRSSKDAPCIIKGNQLRWFVAHLVFPRLIHFLITFNRRGDTTMCQSQVLDKDLITTDTNNTQSKHWLQQLIKTNSANCQNCCCTITRAITILFSRVFTSNQNYL